MFGLSAFSEFSFGQLKVFNPIETAAERRSAFNFCNPFDHVLPLPDSTIDANDRMQLLGWYTGTLVAGPAGSFQAAWARFSTTVTGLPGMGSAQNA